MTSNNSVCVCVLYGVYIRVSYIIKSIKKTFLRARSHRHRVDFRTALVAGPDTATPLDGRTATPAGSASRTAPAGAGGTASVDNCEQMVVAVAAAGDGGNRRRRRRRWAAGVRVLAARVAAVLVSLERAGSCRQPAGRAPRSDVTAINRLHALVAQRRYLLEFGANLCQSD